jgi:hypothetical protein
MGSALRDLSGHHTDPAAITAAITAIRDQSKYHKMDSDMKAIMTDILIGLEDLRDKPSADPYDQFLEVINRFLTETAALGLTKFANRDALHRLL